ncbi:hypothetical protein EON63_14635 [archaeon]|nr:MAG: hypothetical protein EON63_14635 [archaeon]
MSTLPMSSLPIASICVQVRHEHTSTVSQLRNAKVPISPFISTEEIHLPTEEEADRLAEFVSKTKHLVAITGAGKLDAIHILHTIPYSYLPYYLMRHACHTC